MLGQQCVEEGKGRIRPASKIEEVLYSGRSEILVARVRYPHAGTVSVLCVLFYVNVRFLYPH